MFGLFTTAPAWAACPPTAGYTAATKPTLVDRPLDFDCSATSSDQCADSKVVFPSSGLEEWKDELFLWLPGTNAAPDSYEHLANMVGYAGFQGLFLAWDNATTVFQKCQGTSTFLGGDCADSDCIEYVRDELWTGRDNVDSDAHTPHQLDGLEHRLGMALNQEYEADVANVWEWDRFCTPDPVAGTSVNWDQVLVGGHSLGANQATYISYRTRTHGALIVEAGYDFCEVEPFTAIANVHDPSHPYNSTGKEADFYSKYATAPFGDESADLRVFFLHEDEVYPTEEWDVLPPSFAWLTPGDVNASNQPLGASHFQVDGPGSYVDEVFVTTNQVPGCPSANFPSHGSMASDDCLPDAASGSNTADPSGLGTSSIHLFDAYVGALCSF
jgi:hypothetical protein